MRTQQRVIYVNILGQLFLTIAGGLSLAAPTLNRSLGWTLVALVPWSVLLARKSSRWPVVWVIMGWYLVAAPIIYRYFSAWGTPVIFVFISLMLPFVAIFPIAVRFIATRTSLPLGLVVPTVWVVTEYAQSQLVEGHVATYMLGYQLAPYAYLIQTADLGGYYMVSFAVAAVAGGLADLVLRLLDREQVSRRRVVASGGFAVLVYAASFGYGLIRVPQLDLKAGPSFAVVQPNLTRTTVNVLESMLTQTLLTLEHVPRGAAELVIWPENSITDLITMPDKYLLDLAFIGEQVQAEMLVGAFGEGPEDTSRHTNSAFLVSREGELKGRYDKNLLVLWGEYIPWQRLLDKLHPSLAIRHQLLTSKLLGYTPNGVVGEGMQVFETDTGLALAPIVCFENTLPRFAREATRLGADVIVNMTSEGRVGGYMQDQLLAASVFRAIETRRPLVRAGNSGVSCMIGPDGHIHAVLEGLEKGNSIDEPGVLIARVHLNKSDELTFYTRHGDVFAWGNVLFVAAAVLVGLRGRRRADSEPTTSSEVAEVDTTA